MSCTSVHLVRKKGDIFHPTLSLDGCVRTLDESVFYAPGYDFLRNSCQSFSKDEEGPFRVSGRLDLYYRHLLGSGR